VKQLAGKDCKMQALGLFTIDEDRCILLYKADHNFTIGRKTIQIADTSRVYALIFNASGTFIETDSIDDSFLKRVPSISGNQWLLKSKVRNGNYFLAYGINSPIRLPVGLSWSIAYLDGIGHRLWEKHLPENIQISQLELLPDGKCLLVGNDELASGNKNIWIGLWDEYGHQIWQKSIGGKSDDMAYSASADAEGSIFVSGYFSADSSFLGNTNDLSGNEKDGFIACYTKDGNERFFSRQRGTGFNSVNHLAIQALGKVFFASVVQGRDWRLSPYGFSKIGSQDLVIGFMDPKQKEENENPLRIFPNPAKEVVYFGLNKKIAKGKLQAILHPKNGNDLQQMEISGEPNTSFKFNVSNTKPGAYYITVKGKNKSVSRKVIVE